MAPKWTLDMGAMQEDFFVDTALIGISASLPGYRFCWLLNRHFDTAFVREPDMDICIQPSKTDPYYFQIYQYLPPLSSYRHLIYKLRSEKRNLMPEIRQLDYLWLVQDSNPAAEAIEICGVLKNIPEIQLSQVLPFEKLKNLNNLLV